MHVASTLPDRRPLHGRDGDIADLHDRVRAGSRLVTITGPAGTGKTSLLVELGHWHNLRAVFADLTEATDIADICRTVGTALGVSLMSRDPVHAIGEALRRRGPTVLLLDNFEQVASSAARTVGVWHLAAPELTQVITSRIALRLGAEERFTLAPLVLPSDDTISTISTSPAVKLFVDRARRHDRHFQLNADNAAAVAGLVRGLEGMPLAIELAAARIKLMPPRKLLARLDRQLSVLRGTYGAGPRRQWTLEQAIAWSWKLLTPDQAESMAQLAVFEGGFTLHAAEHLLGSRAASILEDLIDQSLLRPADAEGRFRLFAAVKAFARAGASPVTDLTAAHARHADWVIRATSCGEMGKDDLPNAVIAAKRMAAIADVSRVGPTALAAHALLRKQGPIQAAEALLTAALAIPQHTRARLDLLTARIEVHQQLGARTQAHEDLTEAIPLAESLKRPDTLAHLKRTEAVLHHDAKHMVRAEAAYHQVLSLYEALGDDAGQTLVQRNLGHLYRETGQHQLATRCLEDSLRRATASKDPVAESSTRGAFGLLYLERGQLEEARQALQIAIDAARHTGDAGREAVYLSNLGLALAEAGQFAEAHRTLIRSIELHEQVGQRRLLGLSLGYRGNVFLSEGRANEARPLLETAVEICRELDVPEGEGAFRSSLAAVYGQRGQLERARQQLHRAEELLESSAVRNDLIELHLRRARLEWKFDPATAERALAAAERGIAELGLGASTRFAREAQRLNQRSPTTTMPPDLDDDDTVGAFTLLEEIGRGGMGTVWRASGPSGEVAIKRMHEPFARNRAIRERFYREARVGSLIHHPGVVKTLHAGETEGLPYLVMEFVQGRSLLEQIRAEGPLSAEQTLQVARSLLSALAAIHEAGVLHRDVKPHNVMMSPDGPKLADMGIARMRDATTALTSSGQFVGSTRYAAPEQFYGSYDLDERADLYALGVTLFEVCTNKSPFPKQPLQALFLTKSTRPAPRPSELDDTLDPRLDALICWLTAPHPEQRPASAAATLQALDLDTLPSPMEKEQDTVVGFLVPGPQS